MDYFDAAYFDLAYFDTPDPVVAPSSGRRAIRRGSDMPISAPAVDVVIGVTFPFSVQAYGRVDDDALAAALL